MKKQKNNQKEELPLRLPAVAGVFYPADKNTLEAQIDKFLSQAEDVEVEGELKMLILPHAGYEYCGQVMAYGFKKLIDKNFKTVILIGPSHTDFFRGASVYEKGRWLTPLGEVKIDSNLAKKLVGEEEMIFYRPESHEEEHCLEVLLPFLQKVLKNFKIVPIIIGPATEDVQFLGRALRKYIDKETLIIISSDLSHYPPYEIAKKVDKKTIDAILTGKQELFEKAIKESMEAGYENLQTCACGEGPIKVALYLGEKMGLNKIKLLKYANSGDVTKSSLNVVGYAAIAFSLTENKEESLSFEEREFLLKVARQSIEAHFRGEKIPDFRPISERIMRPQGAFVTLKNKGRLRGCIGTIVEEEKPLYKVVSERAIDATRDSRFTFNPVTLEETKDIKIEISVLSPPKKIKDPYKEIELGKHGVIIRKGPYGGVFLPQVATETGWDLERFMAELSSQKAGLPPNAWKEEGVDIYTFTAEVFGEEE